jgi:hypothetical protein
MGRVLSSSAQLTGAGQMLRIEMSTGMKTTGGYPNCTHVHQPATSILGPRFSRLYMDCTNHTTGYDKMKFSLSSPYNFQLDVRATVKQFLMRWSITEDIIRRMTSVDQRKQVLIHVVSEHQQRTLHKEGNWVDTSVCLPSLPLATSGWEAIEED